MLEVPALTMASPPNILEDPTDKPIRPDRDELGDDDSWTEPEACTPSFDDTSMLSLADRSEETERTSTLPLDPIEDCPLWTNTDPPTSESPA